MGVLKKTGISILGAVVIMSAIPYMDVLAEEQYPFIYDDVYAQSDGYMALTEVLEDYTVLAGDSLWKIAKEQFGDGNYYLELADANKNILTDPDLIYPGMCIEISRTGYILKDKRSRGGIQMGEYEMDMPYGWTIGLTQSGDAYANFVMSGDGSIACLIHDKTKAVSADVVDWKECMQKISKYTEEKCRKQVSDLHFEHYRMDNQAGASGEIYLYSYVWHISPDEYPSLTCRVCVGLKLTEHIQAEFVGYTLDDYDIQSCVRYITASFEEHFDSENAKEFTVNNTNMSIAPVVDWPLNGMYNSFAYIDEFYTSRLNKIKEENTENKSRYHSIYK